MQSCHSLYEFIYESTQKYLEGLFFLSVLHPIWLLQSAEFSEPWGEGFIEYIH